MSASPQTTPQPKCTMCRTDVRAASLPLVRKGRFIFCADCVARAKRAVRLGAFASARILGRLAEAKNPELYNAARDLFVIAKAIRENYREA